MDGHVVFEVGAGDVGADVDEVFDLVVGGDEGEDAAGGADVVGVADVAADAGDGLGDVDGGVVAAIGQGAVEPDVAVGDAFDGVGDGLVEIVAFDKHRVEPCYRACGGFAGALEDLWQE